MSSFVFFYFLKIFKAGDVFLVMIKTYIRTKDHLIINVIKKNICHVSGYTLSEFLFKTLNKMFYVYC